VAPAEVRGFGVKRVLLLFQEYQDYGNDWSRSLPYAE
jgi:hypothetical protein